MGLRYIKIYKKHVYDVFCSKYQTDHQERGFCFRTLSEFPDTPVGLHDTSSHDDNRDMRMRDIHIAWTCDIK